MKNFQEDILQLLGIFLSETLTEIHIDRMLDSSLNNKFVLQDTKKLKLS
jgi:hypothetical protein